MTSATIAHVRRADIRVAVARGAAFLDRAWPAAWWADINQQVTWWNCPLHQLGLIVDIEPADDAELAAERAAFALGLTEEDGRRLGFWFPLAGSDGLDVPLIRAWERAWAAERAARANRRKSPPPVARPGRRGRSLSRPTARTSSDGREREMDGNHETCETYENGTGGWECYTHYARGTYQAGIVPAAAGHGWITNSPAGDTLDPTGADHFSRLGIPVAHRAGGVCVDDMDHRIESAPIGFGHHLCWLMPAVPITAL